MDHTVQSCLHPPPAARGPGTTLSTGHLFKVLYVVVGGV